MRFVSLAVLLSLGLARTASAQEVEPAPVLPMQQGGVVAPRVEPPPAQRYFALLLTGGNAYGLGVSLATPRVGVELSFGYTPILATYARDSRSPPDFHFVSAFELGVVPFVELYRASRQTLLGAAAGYRYNTVLHHGFEAALFVRYDFSPHWGVHLFVGPSIFPRAEARLREHESLPPGGSVSSGIAALRGLFGASLALYP